MPAFTAIGAYVAGTLLGLTAGTFAFVAVSSIVAIGAAYVTSRLINGNPNKGGLDSGSQGGRIQVPPATNNKIPVVYGSAFVNGIITDAWLSSTSGEKGDIMHYCLVLSETCNVSGATYTMDDVYWGDLRLVFETGSGDRHKVLKGVKKVNGPGEDFENADFKIDGNNHVEIRVYAGNSTSARQIFPTTDTPVNAYDYWPAGEWTSAHQMEGLVFAIVKLRYSADKGFTNLPAVTFKLTNSVSNPAEVWRDYMTSDRYGAGIDTAAIPTTAGSAYDKWYNYCDELIRYTDKDAVSTTQKRYAINGVVDTSNSVKTNIDSLMQNGGAWLSYDVATGYWNPVIKKAITAGDPADNTTHFTGSIASTTLTVTAFPEGRIEPGQALYNTAGTYIGTIVSQTTPLIAGESTGQVGRYTISATGTGTTFYTTAVGLLQFDDDNIISGIGISSTRLDDLYNKYEAEFFDKYNRDQRAYARDELDPADRNPNEPDNQLRLGLEFTNNSVQANLLANIELRQSRDDLVIDFTASHYGIQASAGDVIAVTNDIYGWAPKLFRVMRVKEIETEEGGLVAQIQALEYNGDVYTIEALTEFTTEANVGIRPTQGGGANGNYRAPNDNLVNVVETNANASVPYIVLAVSIPHAGGPYEYIDVWYAEGLLSTPPAENRYSRLLTHRPPPPELIFENGREYGVDPIVVTSITTSNTLNTSVAHGLSAGDQVYFTSTTANGLTQNKGYWVITAGLTTTAFRLSLTENGSAIALTNGTGLSLNFYPTHLIYLTNLPANTTTNEKYYFRVRIGGQGYYSNFTDPDPAQSSFQTYQPYGGGNINLGTGNSMDLSGATEGDTIYYDATTTTWRDTNLLKVNDTTGNIQVANDLVINSHSSTTARGIGGQIASNDYWHIGGYSIGGVFPFNDGALEIATANNANALGSAEPIYVRQYGGLGSSATWPHGNSIVTTLTLLDNFGDTDIPGGLTVGEGAEIRIQSSVNNAKSNALTVQNSVITGSAANGFGVGIDFEAENGSGTIRSIGGIGVEYTDVTNASEDSKLVLSVINNGVPSTAVADFSLSQTNLVGDLVINSDQSIATSYLYAYSGSTQNYLSWDGTTWTFNEDLTINGTTSTTGDLIINSDQTAGASYLYAYSGSTQNYLSWNGTTWAFNEDLDINGTTSTTRVIVDDNSTATAIGIGGNVATNDYWHIGGYSIGGAGSNDGALEIATANNGNEPIYVRQYTGGLTSGSWPYGNTIQRTLTLLDASGNTDMPGDLTIAGSFSAASLAVDSRVYFDSGTLTTSTTTANQTLDSWAAATYRTVKYVISMTSGSAYQAVEILVTHDGTTAYQTTYADIASGASLATFSVIISGGNVLLRTTPTNAVTVYKFSKQLIVV